MEERPQKAFVMFLTSNMFDLKANSFHGAKGSPPRAVCPRAVCLHADFKVCLTAET